ncbi:MAG: bifunctional alpha,alpha-trehalose-phosphate synthase (UDP-forming)/trehalose-phosphatase [Bacteroidota bacterium]|nr:bifunctional alpha,alpha-trehalose-phosphate synthase (UDP-forming)/trehalose-phosphatase [Bacteroidota bacterium]
MKRLLIVANRLPVNVKVENGKITYQSSSGGLATGLDSLETDIEKHWIGWPGIYPNQESVKNEIEATLEKDLIHPVFLSKDEIKCYYEGFSNKTIWPLFHYFSEFTNYERDFWVHYETVNQLFCKKILEIAKPDDIIWVQDYHLMLLPEMIRAHLPQSQIGFFLHIPFPSYELFRTLPWRREILEGLMGADLLGFHTYEYMRHFISAISRILNLEHNLGVIYKENRAIQVDAFPMGIDYQKFNSSIEDATVTKQVNVFREKFGNVKLALSVDRLDYSKGILQRIKAFDRLLTQKPEFKKEVSLILLVVPSRDNVSDYKDLKEDIDKAVGNLNGKHGTLEWTPIYYLYRSLPFKQLSALYNLADIAVVTPFRDGMNLVAKEYVASKKDQKGVLILSEMAGSVVELRDTLCINPNDIDNIVHALEMALTMPVKEQKERMATMQKIISKQTVQKWANDFIKTLHNIHQQKNAIEAKVLHDDVVIELKNKFLSADKKLMLLDYDGTLVPYVERPKSAVPDAALIQLLKDLSDSHEATVVIVSGRDQETLDRWFRDIKVDIIAEYGSWSSENFVWKQNSKICDDWKGEVMHYFKEFIDKTPGSFIEEKTHSIVWHYRKVDAWLANLRVQEFLNTFIHPCTKFNLEIIEGKKSVEVRVADIKKHESIRKWVKREHWDLIIAIGDDQADEEMFGSLPKDAYSIKVGYGATKAKYHLVSYEEVRELLSYLPKNHKILKED